MSSKASEGAGSAADRALVVEDERAPSPSRWRAGFEPSFRLLGCRAGPPEAGQFAQSAKHDAGKSIRSVPGGRRSSAGLSARALETPSTPAGADRIQEYSWPPLRVPVSPLPRAKTSQNC